MKLFFMESLSVLMMVVLIDINRIHAKPKAKGITLYKQV